MISSFYFIGVNLFYAITLNFINDPINNWPLFLITWIFPLLHIVVSTQQPFMLFSVLFFYVMFPTVVITIPIYSFLRLDDFSCKI